MADQMLGMGDVQAVVAEDPDEDLADHALAGALQAAKDNGRFHLFAGVLDAIAEPANQPVVVGLISGTDDRPEVVLDRAPVASLGPDAEPTPKVVSVGRAWTVRDQRNLAIGSAAGVFEPSLAKALPDIVALLGHPGFVMPVRKEQPDVVRAREGQPLAVLLSRVRDNARDAHAAAHG